MPAKPQRRRDVPAIEWIAGAAALVIVLGMLGFIAYEAVVNDAAPPSLRVTIAQTRRSPEGFAVDVVVRNESREAAAHVIVEGTAPAAGGAAIRSDATLDYVAGLSSRRATLLFPGVPSPGITVRVRGFTEP